MFVLDQILGGNLNELKVKMGEKKICDLKYIGLDNIFKL